MNISSLKDFTALLKRAWELRHSCISNLIAPRETLDLLLQGEHGEAVHTGTLLNSVRYYQDIQMQGFYPCFIDLAKKRDEEELQELITWLTHQERPIVLVLIGPLAHETLAKECVRYYLVEPMTATLMPTAASEASLRTRLLESFQNDPKNTAFQPRFFVHLLLEHIEQHYREHRLSQATSEVLETVFRGLQGGMPDPSILARHIKWSLFQYLKSLKDHRSDLVR